MRSADNSNSSARADGKRYQALEIFSGAFFVSGMAESLIRQSVNNVLPVCPVSCRWSSLQLRLPQWLNLKRLFLDPSSACYIHERRSL